MSGLAVLAQRAGHREAGPSHIITPKAAAGTRPASCPLTPHWTEHVARQWVGNVAPLQGEGPVGDRDSPCCSDTVLRVSAVRRRWTHSARRAPHAGAISEADRCQSALRPPTSLTRAPRGAGLSFPALSLSLPLLGRWVTGPWSPCSATCEKGIQHREVTCVYQLQNGTHVGTRPLYCPGPRPAPVQSCEGQDCLSVWEASEWSQVGAGAAAGAETTARGTSGPRPRGPRDLAPFPPLCL